MKRLTTLLLIFSLLTCTSSVYGASKSTSNWKDAYKLIISKYVNSEDYGSDNLITLVDLDQDGIPELFGGLAYRTVNNMEFAYTFKNGKVHSLKQTGPGQGDYDSGLGFNLGMQGFDKGKIRVFKHKQTGKPIVIVRDGTSSAVSSVVGDYAISLKGSKLVSQEISVSKQFEEGTEFSFKGKKMSKSNYDKNRVKYFSQFKQISSNAKQLDALYVWRMMEEGWSKDKIVNNYIK
ncbi:hypothetical protein [Paenibacillus dakarensis]|uniref:hypothetical protein n=1 Tax=Paenibacillus dakarensis TaxID=1527293 RepID=UPI0006D59C26|nr:hypothetical protein [Paenibacillus dakarensis]